MSKRIMVLSTPKDLGDSDLKRFQLDFGHFHDTHITVNMQPSSIGPKRIFLEADPIATPRDIMADPGRAAKIQLAIDAIEDLLKANLEGT